MSERTKELNKKRNKAIRLAWEREQELVSKGKATRDWTPDQQKDILDPHRGKAYDERGRAFVGQHMKSVKAYEDYADNPDNIQFLTKDEHLEAHKGSWNNPTNWYYDPVTKVFYDFGEDELIPCKIFPLSNPVATIIQTTEQDNKKTNDDLLAEEERVKEHPDFSDHSGSEPNQTQRRTEFEASSQEDELKSLGPMEAPKSEGGFFKKVKNVGRFIIDHQQEILQIAGVVGLAVKGISSIVETISVNRNSNEITIEEEPSSSIDAPDNSDIGSVVTESLEKVNRSSPREHEVPGHKQRYHTKNGIEWRDKDPYPIGGKKD